jgi:hypothetical protein
VDFIEIVFVDRRDVKILNARQTSSSEKSSACCLLAVEKSANAEYNILQSMNFLLSSLVFVKDCSSS